MRASGQAFDDLTLDIKEHVLGRTARCHFPMIVSRRCAIGEADDHKAAAAQIARCRVGDRQGKTHGNCGVNRVTALGKNVSPDLGC